jgi:uncharacterized protein (TIGR03437 family)
MVSLHARRVLSVVVTGAVVGCFAVSQKLVAAAPNVIYTAAGTFASPPVSGNDLLQLAGQPFSISIVANSASVPKSHGGNWAVYGGLTMQGTVQSGLEPLPLTIQNRSTSISLATGNPSYDLFAMGTPIIVVGISLSVQARITMPPGTIANALIHPFTAPVTLTPANAILTYSDTSASTTLGINGTLSTVLGATAVPPASAALYAEGARAVTVHADGTQSVRPVRSSPVDLGASTDRVVLQFYASGVSGASEVRVQIGGQEVRVLYAGGAGHFPGLDQVGVEVPRSLLGRGAAPVVMTVDGHATNPVHVQIQ